MEKQVDVIAHTVNAFNKECYGCKRTKKDVMLTVVRRENDQTEFDDIFLTTEQATFLITRLQEALKYNKEN